jgi:hypothetical protein
MGMWLNVEEGGEDMVEVCWWGDLGVRLYMFERRREDRFDVALLSSRRCLGVCTRAGLRVVWLQRGWRHRVVAHAAPHCTYT